MESYQVDGTVRKEACDKSAPITHLTLVEPPKAWSLEKIIKKIENGETEFWSYHYKNGDIDEQTKIKVEVVEAPEGKYLRTRRDELESNNLLELPMYYKDRTSDKYKKCK